ncbi:hypothetical protein TPHA_0E03570 [Tetrapisispora phaffii CBS 4417]|uniref:SPX domain-containing protein n=1 Tax=Tetrapisispora phaffii (strain ATCC 24235 / CBS 4417 / NBRC 1672 / NRRL Y-8282 / UCD 70-5) TaxID=1071381 RepID=G8BU69_TETPH|nr:hypothetical protein TPHA_0E03570 [Tetrapisispora phaffii CBS 4417]CCE63447.1 hypothetical protein TPHA_0E03570 [Tetrapisispora phaffii CBS 4417]
MKFSYFLKYNAVPEWQSHYMDYNKLKDLIYSLQTEELHNQDENFKSNEIEKLPSKTNPIKDDVIREETFELSELRSSSSNGKTGSSRKEKINNTLKKYKPSIFDKTDKNDRKNSLTNSSINSLESNSIGSNSHDIFIKALLEDKVKVDDFYKRTETKFYDKLSHLIKDLEKEGIHNLRSVNEQNEEIQTLHSRPNSLTNELRSRFTDTGESAPDINSVDFEEDEDEDDYAEDNNDHTALLNYSQFNVKSQRKSLLKQSIVNLYIDLCQIKSFIELNRIGFSKISKKFDKVLKMNIRAELIESGEFFKDTYVFQDAVLNILNDRIFSLIEFYSIITGQTFDIESCEKELKQSLHDHIVWVRSTTWKDMLGLASQQNIFTGLVAAPDATAKAQKNKLKLEYYSYELKSPINIYKWELSSLKIPKLFFTWKAFKLAFIFTFTAILLGVKTFNDPVEHRCMALLECVALLWATEAIPLYATALLVPFLTVLFKVLKNDDGTVKSAAESSSTILGAMWSSTIVILLAGFTLGEVLAQYDIAKILASWLLAFAGTKPRNVLLMAMSVVFFLSMWISNVAAPVLTYSLLTPLLDDLDSTSPFGKALVLGIALAANLGGMASPISSPQNIISMEYLAEYGIGWGQFFAISIPTGIISLLLAWGLMCLTFKINTSKIEKFIPIRSKFTLKQYFIVGMTLATILLWCVESQIESAFGSSGIIALLPIVVFFGSGLLNTNDLNTFPWSIVVLAMGGIALGSAVSSSGLLSTVALALQRKIQNDGTYAILCIFGILMLVIGTFVSHTVSAIIIIPLVQEVGDALSDPKSAPILIFGCCLLSSCGMGLASSGFPNVTAISMVDKKGNRYLSMNTFITRGVPCSLLAFLCVITIGYGIMSTVLKGKTS